MQDQETEQESKMMNHYTTHKLDDELIMNSLIGYPLFRITFFRQFLPNSRSIPKLESLPIKEQYKSKTLSSTAH